MPEDLSKLLAKISKKSGGAVTVTALSEVKTPYHERIGFGVPDLDIALGGGVPRGVACELVGAPGVGKNLLSNMHAAEAQRIYGDACNMVFVSFGYGQDPGFMRLCGVKIRFTDVELTRQGIDPETATVEQKGEQLGNIYQICVSDSELASEAPAEAKLDTVLDFIRSCKFHLVVIDEFASGETRHDTKKGLSEDPKMATWASLITGFCKKMYTAFETKAADGNPNATIVDILQPVRANMDPNSAKFFPTVVPSGFALKHAKAVSVELSPAGQIKRGEHKVGKKIKWKLGKGKLGISEGAEGEIEFIFFTPTGDGGIDTVPGIANCAKIYGTIRNSGAFYYILDYEDRITGGLAGVIEKLRADPLLVDELRTRTIRAAATGEV